MQDEMKNRVKRALRATWDIIASDSIECNDGKPLSGDSVCEGVLDANYVERYGRDIEAIAELRKLDYDGQMAITRETFPARYYF